MTHVGQQLGLFGPSHDDNLWISSADAQLITVAFEAGGDNVFDYALPTAFVGMVAPGQRVKAPFGRKNKQQAGFCVGLPKSASVERVKVISDIVDREPLLDQPMMALAKWISQYYCCSLGQVLSAMVPAAVKRQVGMVRRQYVFLTDKGRHCLDDEGDCRLGSKGRAIISALCEADGQRGSQVSAKAGQLVDALAARVGCGKAPFSTLSRKGLVELVTRKEISVPKDSRNGNFSCDDSKGTSETVSDGCGYNSGNRSRSRKSFELNGDQQRVLCEIHRLIKQDNFSAVLLHGVTGSGKTEVYMNCIEEVLASGKQALVLVPEIALTPQTQQRFLERFNHVAVLHSGLTNSERHRQWRWIASGGVKVVVGVRSAVFAPLPNLGLIVVDEEHEPSYKQDNTPRYHGRDIAVKRGQILGIPVVLGSATPSLETLSNCKRYGHYHLSQLPKRVLNLPLPKVVIVDMVEESSQRKGNHLLSRLLEQQLKRCFERGEQAIVLLNRRGHSGFLYCPSCQYIVRCPNCDVSMTCHRRILSDESAKRRWVMCHYCSYSSELPRVCPVCSKKLLLLAPGTQRAEDEFARKLPKVRLCRVDSDSMRKGDYASVLEQFGAGKIDVLLGTQMIGKGLDYPNVSLVGVLNADTALALPDFRSSERTFQLISQVAGRCGRASADGRVVVQSYLPDDPAIRLACKHDYNTFAKQELIMRKKSAMPPYHRQARILMRDMKLAKLEAAGKELRRVIDAIVDELGVEVSIRGPIPATIACIENYQRMEILLRSASAMDIQRVLAKLRNGHLSQLKVDAFVDVDPLNML